MKTVEEILAGAIFVEDGDGSFFVVDDGNVYEIHKVNNIVIDQSYISADQLETLKRVEKALRGKELAFARFLNNLLHDWSNLLSCFPEDSFIYLKKTHPEHPDDYALLAFDTREEIDKYISADKAWMQKEFGVSPIYEELTGLPPVPGSDYFYTVSLRKHDGARACTLECRPTEI